MQSFMRTNAKFLAVIGIVLLAGCATPSFNFPSPPKNEPTKKYHHDETIKREPVIVNATTASGEKVTFTVGEKVEQTYSAGLQATEPKPTLFQRLWGTLGPWLILFIILNVLGIFFPVIGVAMGFFNRSVEWGARKIVGGVDRVFSKLDSEPNRTYSAAEVKVMIQNELSKHYDDKTKKMVNTLKAKNNASN